MAQTCFFCGSTDAAISLSAEFAFCEDCVAKFRRLLGATLDSPPDQPVGFETVDYEYTPADGEVMYFAPEDQFYEVHLRTDGLDGEPMIYLQPVPRNQAATPITDVADEIGAAIGAGSFYRVTTNLDTFETSELWWVTAMALAPDPEGESESSEGVDSGFEFGGDTS